MSLTQALRRLAGVIAAALLLGCAREKVESAFQPSASWEEYRAAIEGLGLSDTALGRLWIEAGRTALERPTPVETPFEEVVLLDPHAPQALAYAFSAARGRVITVTVETGVDRYFSDLFRVDGPVGDAEGARTLVASVAAGSNEIRVEPRRDGVYLLRIQPELLRGGRFAVRIVATASLAFPVEGGGPTDIWSFYGDTRDGGDRIHEGVDIFAARGTPVLAAADAVVWSVATRELGGKTITLRVEETGLVLYYAHLDEQLVRRGERVERGDVIGKVGNTGNAITTPPHLHLGVYEGNWRTDVDPWDYLVDPARVRPPVVEHAELAGEWRSLSRDATLAPEAPVARALWSWQNRNPFLRRAGAGDSRAATAAGDAATGLTIRDLFPPRPLTTLAMGSPVLIVGAALDRVRVRTPQGLEGYLDPASLGPARVRRVLEEAAVVHDALTGDAVLLLERGTAVDVVGATPGRAYLLLPGGRAGYFQD